MASSPDVGGAGWGAQRERGRDDSNRAAARSARTAPCADRCNRCLSTGPGYKGNGVPRGRLLKSKEKRPQSSRAASAHPPSRLGPTASPKSSAPPADRDNSGRFPPQPVLFCSRWGKAKYYLFVVVELLETSNGGQGWRTGLERIARSLQEGAVREQVALLRAC